jgi:hypothetical protein
MKLRILNYGISANHGQMTALASFDNPVAISDYDAFAFDPNALLGQGAHGRALFERRQRELHDLINLKTGIVVCLLRADQQMGVVALGGVSIYGLLDAASPAASALVRNRVRDGVGSQWSLVPAAKGALGGYFRVLQGNLHFEAYLQAVANEVGNAGGTVFAVNSVGYPVAAEFVVVGGRVCFVPIPRDVPGDRVGAAIARIVDTHFGGPTEIDIPAWASEVIVPGATASDNRIGELEEKKNEVDAEISALKDKRSELTNYRRLLFGYGKTLLEPVVRQAFRLLGFEVPEPEQYAGEWDVELKEPASGKTAIGEVEGSEGAIDVDKYRQLLDYFQAEVLEGRIHKGILIGNGWKSKELDAPERRTQFTEHALRGARQNAFCMLPTSELFKVVCAVLESPSDEALRIEIRDSILSTIGIWTFARDVVTPSRAVGGLKAAAPPPASGS